MPLKENLPLIDSYPLAVPSNYLKLYLRGNAIWPQKHFVHPLLIADEALRVNTNMGELMDRQFTATQINDVVARAMNRLHSENNVNKFYDPSQTLPAEQLVRSDDITKLWERAIVEGTSWVIAFASLMSTLSPYASSVPNLREAYYEEKGRATHIIKNVDTTLKKHPGESSDISKLLSQTEAFFRTEEFRERANAYRTALTDAHSRGSDLLEIGGARFTKKQYTQVATDQLTLHLKKRNPQYDWNGFRYIY